MTVTNVITSTCPLHMHGSSSGHNATSTRDHSSVDMTPADVIRKARKWLHEPIRKWNRRKKTCRSGPASVTTIYTQRLLTTAPYIYKLGQ